MSRYPGLWFEAGDAELMWSEIVRVTRLREIPNNDGIGVGLAATA
jgi:hypothetical protein